MFIMIQLLQPLIFFIFQLKKKTWFCSKTQVSRTDSISGKEEIGYTGNLLRWSNRFPNSPIFPLTHG